MTGIYSPRHRMRILSEMWLGLAERIWRHKLGFSAVVFDNTVGGVERNTTKDVAAPTSYLKHAVFADISELATWLGTFERAALPDALIRRFRSSGRNQGGEPPQNPFQLLVEDGAVCCRIFTSKKLHRLRNRCESHVEETPPPEKQMRKPAAQRGGRSWHDAPRFRTEGKRPLAGAVAFCSA